MINALVLDIDGVLVEPMVFASVLARDYGLTLQKTASFFRGPFEDCLLGRTELKEELPRYLEAWKWPHSIDDFLRLWFEADSRINKPMLKVARAMHAHGLRCYIASTQEANRASYLENLFGRSELFESYFFSCRLACQKPARQFYDYVARSTGIAPGDLLFLDDCEANVVGARNAGWNAEVYAWGMDVKALLRKYSIAP